MTSPRRERPRWLTRGVGGIGVASLLSDAGHEIPTSLLPSLLTSTLGAPAAALGLIEGLADAAAGAAKLVGGGLADDPARRRTTAVGGYTVTAVLSALIGVAGSVMQVAICRIGAWTARGLRVPSRNALLADAVPPDAYGRAYGFERTMDNVGAILGPAAAVALVGWLGLRGAIVVSLVPGLLAALAIVVALRSLPAARRTRTRVRLRLREATSGGMGRVFVGIAAFEAGNIAATLLILRASELLSPSIGQTAATQRALWLYVAYNAAAAIVSTPAGYAVDRIGSSTVAIAGVVVFALAYAIFGRSGGSLVSLGAGFVLAGAAIGGVETAEHAVIARYASSSARGSAFGVLAAIQSGGNLVASALAGVLWTVASPGTAFAYATGMMIAAAVVLMLASTRLRSVSRLEEAS